MTLGKEAEIAQRTNPIPWPARIAIGLAAALLGFFSDQLGGWGLPSVMAGAAIVVPTMKYQRYWGEKWFWFTILGMTALQPPLVILARPLMEQLRFGFNLLFVSIDALLVITVVNWVRPKDDSDGK